MKLFDLSRHTALVTGLSMSIGASLARRLAQVNAALVLNARNADHLEETANVLRAERGKVEKLLGAAIFLASDAAIFVIGHTLFVDGGIMANL